MRKCQKLCLLLLFLFVTSLFITACGGDTKDAKNAPPKESKIVVAQGSDALFLDPQQQDEGPTNTLTTNIYDGLVNRKADLSIEPGLAEKWEQKDPLTWIFHLRKNVQFHNGNPFTADDVVFTIERAKKQKIGVNFVRMIASAKKIDDYTVELKTPTPHAVFLDELAKVLIIDKEYVTKVGDQEFNLKPVGTGPYKAVEWVKEDHITLQANDKYWKGVPAIKTVIFRPISNEATRTAALLSGEVDLITDVPVRDADRIIKNEKLSLVRQPSLRLIYLTVDVSRDKTPMIDLPKNPMKDDRVKKAMRMGLDIDSIIKNIMNGYAYPATQGNPKVVAGYVDDIPRVKYDPEQAKKLLAEAGYPQGFTVTLDSPNNRYTNDFKVAEAIAAQWAKIGINVKLNLMPKALFFDYVRAGDKTSICLVGWSSDNGDAGMWYRIMFYTRDKVKGAGGSNRGHYANPEYDALLDKADATANKAERTQYLQQATRVLDKDMALIPLYFQEDIYGLSKNLEFTPRIDKFIYAYDIRIKK